MEGYETRHIGVLDGIRAVAVLIVVWYHFWQQSWVIPKIGPISLDWLPRNGSILVDMMILLTGFCLFLPYARSMVYGDKTQNTASFYVKRVARIMPSYYVSILVVLFIFAIPLGEYASTSVMWDDLLPHLTFTHNIFEASMQNTHLNGVLWTVAVEMQFYLIFPLLAKLFQKWPVPTYIGMTLVGLISSFLISDNFDTLNTGMYVNHTLTFFCVYANGMLGAWLYVAMTKDRTKNKAEGILFTLVSLTSIWIYKILCEHRMSSASETKWQVDNRYLLSLVLLLFVISTILSARWFQVIWDNKIMRFLAGISFNLYICHQYVSVKLKEMHIPFWEGDTPPNQLGDTVWQWKYMLLCIAVSLVIATAMTYLIEKPASKLIMKIYNKYRKSTPVT